MSVVHSAFGPRLIPQAHYFVRAQERFCPVRRHLWPGLLSILLVAFTTAGLIGLSLLAELPNVSSVYLMPVLIAATLSGVIPAVVAALMSMAASAFFFYPPIYSLQVGRFP
jgi:two-component system sensor histidine kinase KdpD